MSQEKKHGVLTHCDLADDDKLERHMNTNTKHHSMTAAINKSRDDAITTSVGVKKKQALFDFERRALKASEAGKTHMKPNKLGIHNVENQLVNEMNQQTIEMYKTMLTRLENKKDEYQKMFDALEKPTEMTRD